MRLLKLLQLHGRAPTSAEVRLLSERGLMEPTEACAIIEHLRRNGFFAPPMSADRCLLLAVLARAGHARPHLIVDNASYGRAVSAGRSRKPQPPSAA